MNDITTFASSFRKAIEAARDDGRFDSDQMFRHFPTACCGIASELLARYLLDNGYNATYICGTCRKNNIHQSHAWLEVDGVIVDITGDQFRNNEILLNNDISIYVGSLNRFYNLFEIDIVEKCNNHYPLDDTQIRNHLSRRKLYEIIQDYI